MEMSYLLDKLFCLDPAERVDAKYAYRQLIAMPVTRDGNSGGPTTSGED